MSTKCCVNKSTNANLRDIRDKLCSDRRDTGLSMSNH